jgi:hypothetical protein
MRSLNVQNNPLLEICALLTETYEWIISERDKEEMKGNKTTEKCGVSWPCRR